MYILCLRLAILRSNVTLRIRASATSLRQRWPEDCKLFGIATLAALLNVAVESALGERSFQSTTKFYVSLEEGMFQRIFDGDPTRWFLIEHPAEQVSCVAVSPRKVTCNSCTRHGNIQGRETSSASTSYRRRCARSAPSPHVRCGGSVIPCDSAIVRRRRASE